MDILPHAIVDELDKHVVGQSDAKRVIAVALRNRWRRKQIPAEQRSEISPKNILMVGPTGVGKTEIARRIAKMEDAPFIKVEATKYTEVGYVGESVDDIISDLVQNAIKKIEQRKVEGPSVEKVPKRLRDLYERTVHCYLTPVNLTEGTFVESDGGPSQVFRKLVQQNTFDDHFMEIRYDSAYMSADGAELIPAVRGKSGKKIKLKVKAFRKRFLEIEDKPALSWQFTHTGDASDNSLDSLIGSMFGNKAAPSVNPSLKAKAIKEVESDGIVFIDEIDKLAIKSTGGDKGVSRTGVQRDLLTLVEGTTVNTKFGPVDTTNILFIASGAFHVASVSDLLPELQGRFPIKVQLQPLSVKDFVEILSHTEMSIIAQYKMLLATDGVELDIKDDAIQRMAEIATELNKSDADIGARRLHAVIEALLEEASYEVSGTKVKVVIDKAYVDKQLAKLKPANPLASLISRRTTDDKHIDYLRKYVEGSTSTIPASVLPRIESFMELTDVPGLDAGLRAEWYRNMMYGRDPVEAGKECLKEWETMRTEMEAEKKGK
jgi:ATP-dependent HslUV protease ATP-binding subunit HslU